MASENNTRFFPRNLEGSREHILILKAGLLIYELLKSQRIQQQQHNTLWSPTISVDLTTSINEKKKLSVRAVLLVWCLDIRWANSDSKSRLIYL